MCESRKRKHESGKTVKGIFKKDDLDDSLSASEWGLFIDDNPKWRKRSQTVKLEEEPLTLICDWNNCYQDFSEFFPFNDHVKQHLADHNIEDDDDMRCLWSECDYSAVSHSDFYHHACYHAYHTKLKCVGRNVEERTKLPKCVQSEHFTVPVVVEGYQCEWVDCYERFWTIIDFFEHVKIHVFHSPKVCKEGDIKCFWKGCTASRLFISQYKLTDHLKIHTKEKIIACPTCGNLFANKTKFCDHRRRQLPVNLQSYLCSQCSKYFPSERLLRDHMRLHINHYKCSMCEMTCPKPSILAKHIRYRHVNEKPFKCNQCDYRCVSKHNLDIHLKTHEPHGQFRCEDCHYKCRSEFGLILHAKKAHEKILNNIYECHNCKKQFIRGGLLTKHLMKVHNYHWPSGHSRFRYKEDSDGIYRLQTVRYETLDVTEEIIRGKTVQAPSETLKFDILKKEDDSRRIDTFEVVLAEDKKPEKKPVLITIDDIDAKGNILKSRTIESSEISCEDVTTDGVDEKIILLGSSENIG